MGDFDPVFVKALAVQSWILYGIGMLLICLRMYARIHRLGIKGLQPDDFLMVLTAGLYTALIVCLNVIAGGGGSNLYPPELFSTFTPLEKQERINGSKIVVVSEQAMLNVIYSIKCCMLIMYTRLTLGLQVQRLVVYLAIYVAIGWAATEIAFFTACRPFYGYWAMPPPDPQCTTLEHYAIVQGCFNISSDTLMLLIPIPLVLKLAMPFKQKVILLIIFSMGVFVILAAILTKVFNLMNVWDPSYMLWYTREASVAVYVSNLPMIWPLLREWFPVLKNMTPGQKSTASKGYGGASAHFGSGVGGRPRTTTIGGRHLSGGFGGKRLSDGGVTTTIRGKGESTEELSSGDDTEMGALSRMDSWEQRPVTGHGSEDAKLVGWESDMKKVDKGIHMVTTVQVSREHVDEVSHPPRVAIRGPGDVEKGFEWRFEGRN